MATAVVTTVLDIFGGGQAVTGDNTTIGFVVLMLVLLAINLGGTAITKGFNNISTLGKVAALVLVIAAGLVVLVAGGSHFDELRHLTKPDGNPAIGDMSASVFVGAVLSAFYACTGFETAAASFSTPRIFDALSEKGMLPAVTSRKNSRGVPVVAFGCTAAVAILIPMAFDHSMRGIMVISSVSRFLQFLVILVVGLLASVYLMVEFDWNGQFSTTDGRHDWFAIGAMLIGYGVVPLDLRIPWRLGAWRRSERVGA